eukprot:RCo035945
MTTFPILRHRRALFAVTAVYALCLCGMLWSSRCCCDCELPSPQRSLYTHLNATRAARQCSWANQPHLQNLQSHSKPRDVLPGCRAVAGEVASFFEHLFDNLGIIVVARNGWSLGAYRERGQIGGDCDGDVFLIIPQTIPKCCVVNWIQREAARFQRIRTLSLHTWSAFLNIIYNGFDSMCLWYRDSSAPYGLSAFGVDLDVIDEQLIYENDLYDRAVAERTHGLSPRLLFDNLCRCPFQSTNLLCFDSPVIERLLTHSYGPGYMTPKSDGGATTDLTQLRWFWSTAFGQWLIKVAGQAASDFFVFFVD